MNCKKKIKGSSETIRETTFDFSKYKEKSVTHKKNIDPSFLEWFIGFFEGDGSFIVSKSPLFFIISQKEVLSSEAGGNNSSNYKIKPWLWQSFSLQQLPQIYSCR